MGLYLADVRTTLRGHQFFVPCLEHWVTISVSATPDKNLSPRMPLASNAAGLWPRTEATVVADASIEAEHRTLPRPHLLPRAQGRTAWTGATGWCMVGALEAPWGESFVKGELGMR